MEIRLYFLICTLCMFYFQHVSKDVYWYYLIELAFYWSLVFSVVTDHRRKVMSHSLFVWFVALRPKSTAMVMVGGLVHLTSLFHCKLEQAVNQYFVHILSLVTDNNPS